MRVALFNSRFKLYCILFQLHYKIPFNFYRPGLEIKFACEEAVNTGARLDFLGPEFNQVTWNRLMHETRTTMLGYLFKKFQYWGHHMYAAEKTDIQSRLHNSEPSQFTEQCCDTHLINWYI